MPDPEPQDSPALSFPGALELPPLQAGAPYGPVTFARMLLDPNNKVLATAVHRALRVIERETFYDNGTWEPAARAKEFLEGWYTTSGQDQEFVELGINKDNQSALLRCTDRNNLISAAARIGKGP